MKAFKRTLLAIFIILILTLIMFFWLGGRAINNIELKDLDENNLEISNKLDKNIKNIAFFGLDTREKNNNGRSDSIIIATLNQNTQKIKLTSIMRDIAVDIEGYNREKLNHAYAYGGPELAIKTLNKTFDINVSDYVTVNFYDLANMIDLVGGINITLKDYEPVQINNNLSEINKLENLKDGTDYVYKSGVQTLNGRQAVAYARIRKEGNGDYERTQRQKIVLEEVFNKIQSKPSVEALNLVTDMFEYVETSLSIIEIINLTTEFLKFSDFGIEQYRIPVDGAFESGTQNGMWLIEMDLEKNIEALHQYMEN